MDAPLAPLVRATVGRTPPRRPRLPQAEASCRTDDEYAPDLVWLDHAKLKFARGVKPGDEFAYVYGIVPPGPVAIWGWGWIPDQSGRRSEHGDGEEW
jgi:hypothetical protein